MTTEPSDDEPQDDDAANDIALTPGDTGHPACIVQAGIPADTPGCISDWKDDHAT